MTPLSSRLFADDGLLQNIADDVNRARISQSANPQGPSVGRVQRALLLWKPGILPTHGPDEAYGDETAAAVHLFKVEELGVPEAEVIDDVGPKTVQRLDEIARSFERDTPDEADPVPDELAAAVRLAAPGLLALPGVIGVGAGLRAEAGELVDEVTVQVFVSDESLAGTAIPGEIAGVSVHVTRAEIKPCAPDANRYAEVKGGIRIGHPSPGGGAGTLGAIVKDRATGELLGLTNQHVVGNPGDGFPRVVYQPGPENVLAHANVSHADAVGAVVKAECPRRIPRHTAGMIVSDVDAAVFKVDELPAQSRTVSPAIVGKDALGAILIDAVKSTGEPFMKRDVRKRGFSTSVTFGRVRCTRFYCCWEPGGPDHVLYEQALAWNPLRPFCDSGDSGALVLDANAPIAVGLVYGNVTDPTGYYGIIVKMPLIEERLGVTVAWA